MHFKKERIVRNRVTFFVVVDVVVFIWMKLKSTFIVHIPNNFSKPPELRDITVSLKQCISFTHWAFWRCALNWARIFTGNHSELIIEQRWYLFLVSSWNSGDSSRKFLHFFVLANCVAQRNLEKAPHNNEIIFSSISSMCIFHFPTRFQRNGDGLDVALSPEQLWWRKDVRLICNI